WSPQHCDERALAGVGHHFLSVRNCVYTAVTPQRGPRESWRRGRLAAGAGHCAIRDYCVFGILCLLLCTFPACSNRHRALPLSDRLASDAGQFSRRRVFLSRVAVALSRPSPSALPDGGLLRSLWPFRSSAVLHQGEFLA